MVLSAREVAEAFSGHDFEDAFPYLSKGVIWRMPGSDGLQGRDAVVAACRATDAALTDTQVDVTRFIVVDGGDTVAVDTVTGYRDGDETSTVASCDIYEFRDGEVVQITSYAVEI
jgi:ketosteroid isomerase-like protein